MYLISFFPEKRCNCGDSNYIAFIDPNIFLLYVSLSLFPHSLYYYRNWEHYATTQNQKQKEHPWRINGFWIGIVVPMDPPFRPVWDHFHFPKPPSTDYWCVVTVAFRGLVFPRLPDRVSWPPIRWVGIVSNHNSNSCNHCVIRNRKGNKIIRGIVNAENIIFGDFLEIVFLVSLRGGEKIKYHGAPSRVNIPAS